MFCSLFMACPLFGMSAIGRFHYINIGYYELVFSAVWFFCNVIFLRSDLGCEHCEIFKVSLAIFHTIHERFKNCITFFETLQMVWKKTLDLYFFILVLVEGRNKWKQAVGKTKDELSYTVEIFSVESFVSVLKCI